jgi:hypothetical protein
MMYREDYYEEDSDRPGITDIYIRKHRNGPTGRVELHFKREQMRFYDVDKASAPSADGALMKKISAQAKAAGWKNAVAVHDDE